MAQASIIPRRAGFSNEPKVPATAVHSSYALPGPLGYNYLMRLYGIAAAVLGLSAAGCASLAPARKAPAPVKATVPAPRGVTAEERKEIDRQYFEAVSAYVRGDAIQARVWLNRILDVDPDHAEALALKRRLNAAARP